MLLTDEKHAIRAMGAGGLGADFWLEELDVSAKRFVYLFRVWVRWRRRFCG